AEAVLAALRAAVGVAPAAVAVGLAPAAAARGLRAPARAAAHPAGARAARGRGLCAPALRAGGLRAGTSGPGARARWENVAAAAPARSGGGEHRQAHGHERYNARAPGDPPFLPHVVLLGFKESRAGGAAPARAMIARVSPRLHGDRRGADS